MLANLFSFYLDHPDRMPEPYAGQAASEPVHRVVCDYIAGMTDRFAILEYKRLFDPDARV
jgi:dGTPase